MSESLCAIYVPWQLKVCLQQLSPHPFFSFAGIVHFPEEPSKWSYGSGYCGRCCYYVLRIASVVASLEGCLVEHCRVLGLTSPGLKFVQALGNFL